MVTAGHLSWPPTESQLRFQTAPGGGRPAPSRAELSCLSPALPERSQLLRGAIADRAAPRSEIVTRLRRTRVMVTGTRDGPINEDLVIWRLATCYSDLIAFGMKRLSTLRRY